MKRRHLFSLLFLFFLFIFAGLAVVIESYKLFTEDGPLTDTKTVYVERGMSLSRITDYLYDEGVIDNKLVFNVGVRLNKNAYQLKMGEYAVPPKASAKMVMDILTRGQTVIRRVTIPEGLTSIQIMMLIDAAPGLEGLLNEVPTNGTLLPDTYYYSLGDTKESIILRMQLAMSRTISELWQHRQAGLPIKTPEEAIILASIVEKETGIADERRHVASVFVNRLVQNMRLQSDPTVIFALSDGSGILERQLWSNDLKIDHTHNTYVIKGLPPTAIANPGRASLEAVLNPLDTNDLYFVADGKGGHVFAPTYDEHNINVRRWRQVKKSWKTTPTPPSVPENYVRVPLEVNEMDEVVELEPVEAP